MPRTRILCLSAAIFVISSTLSSFAQTAVTAVEVERLETDAREVGQDLTRLSGRDPELARQLQRQLDDLREEAIYLKVKLRKDGAVTAQEYADVRDRLGALRVLARPTSSTASSTTSPTTSRPPVSARPGAAAEVPVGTEFDVRLQAPLNSGTAQVEDVFEATTLVDLSANGQLLIPAGSVLRGIVETVEKATRTDRRGAVTVSFNRITINGRNFPLLARVTQALQSGGVRDEAGRIGTGAGVGAIVGGILGGLRGAFVGILVGGGGTMAATEGKDVDLPAGTVLRVRLDAPLQLAP